MEGEVPSAVDRRAAGTSPRWRARPRDTRRSSSLWAAGPESSSPDLERPQVSHSSSSRLFQKHAIIKAPTSDHALDGLFEVLGVDGRVQVSGGDQRRLVADVGDVGS